MTQSVKKHTRGLLFACLLMLGASLSAVAAEKDSPQALSFCNSHWPPFSYGGPGGQALGGYAVTFLQDISVRTRIPINLKILPWKRCLYFAERGEIDGIMMLTRNSDRETFLDLTDPLLSDSNLLWYRKDSEHVADRTRFEELKGLTIGLTSGFNYGDAFAEAVKRLELRTEEAPTILSNFRKLELGRIDVFLVNKVVAEFNLKPDPAMRERVTHRQGPFPVVGFHIGLSKKGGGVTHLADFNAAIADMTASGRIDSILQDDPLPLLSNDAPGNDQ